MEWETGRNYCICHLVSKTMQQVPAGAETSESATNASFRPVLIVLGQLLGSNMEGGSKKGIRKIIKKAPLVFLISSSWCVEQAGRPNFVLFFH